VIFLTINHWQASKGCVTLDRFGVLKKPFVGRVMRQTSVESNQVTEKDGQIALMLDIYRLTLFGLTDEETRLELLKRGVNIPNSTVSARRNDINNNHVRFCDANGLHSSHLIVSDTRRENPTPPHRSAMVWKLKKYCEVDLYE